MKNIKQKNIYSTTFGVDPIFGVDPTNTQLTEFPISCVKYLAEREGFEPPEPCSSTVFKTAAIDHSATSPFKFFYSTVIQAFFNLYNYFFRV